MKNLNTVTRQQVEDLKEGDYVPTIFGSMQKVSRIICKKTDDFGKRFAIFYQRNDYGWETSRSIKEDRQWAI